MHVTGSCHCGEINFEAEIDPGGTRICHCTDCQKLSGSPFRVVVAVPEDRFRLLSGHPKIYVKISESGNERQQAFCSTCGTPIYATSNGPGPRKIGIRVGALDAGYKLVPERQFWTRSGVSWLDRLPKIAGFEQQP